MKERKRILSKIMSINIKFWLSIQCILFGWYHWPVTDTDIVPLKCLIPVILGDH